MNPQTPTGMVEAQAVPNLQWKRNPVEVPEPPPEDLPYDDGEPLESDWHRSAMNLLIEVVRYHFRDREDFFAGGNMFLYYNEEQLRDRDFRGPDFFFVWGVDRRRERNYYAIWREGGRYPNVILELLSLTTAKIDRTLKRELYQNTFRTPEYFLCDPYVGSLEGLRLNGTPGYEAIAPDERGWLWSKQLQMWLGTWSGEFLGQTATWPRFYDADGQLVPTFAEAAQQHAEQEKQRAEAAEAETARLRRELDEMRQRFPKVPE